MAQRTRRGKRRGPVNDTARPATPQTSNGNGDRYEKYLPEWMRGSVTPPRPPRPRRARPARPAGGYTPGKMALGDSR